MSKKWEDVIADRTERLVFEPYTDEEKRQDSAAEAEAAWRAERRRCAPNLHRVIDAAQARLEGDLPAEMRDRLEMLMVGLSHFQRNKFELSESDRDEQLRLIEGL